MVSIIVAVRPGFGSYPVTSTLFIFQPKPKLRNSQSAAEATAVAASAASRKSQPKILTNLSPSALNHRSSSGLKCTEENDASVKALEETLGKEKFTREILYMCPSRGIASYLEAREQFERRVLESDDYYNGIINVRIGGSKILKEYLGNENGKTKL